MERKDPRLNAFRSDLADRRLKGEVQAQRFVEGERKRVGVPVSGLFKDSQKNEIQTECLLGEDLLIFEHEKTISWGQSLKDGYVGYIDTQALYTPTTEPTHVVSVARTFQYLQSDLRGPKKCALSIGSKVNVVDIIEVRDTTYSILEDGTSVVSRHLAPIGIIYSDYVTIAQTLLHTPYLWGGVSGFGLDCSGLVQLSMMLAGQSILRDTDMQRNTVGKQLTEDSPLQRGDLIFWKDHVAIMLDYQNIIHASGNSMSVVIEPLKEVIARIAKKNQYPIARRRPFKEAA
ncbi:C40 family peptidase [Bartonella ancashensis]|uniref:NlpC/P60 domain-containing protein n=1 Tax=Bartonella ancashensis TaxID=1318743 RepID=A0A0M3T2V3_9HYPH|nr:NlpC/P60 family protein [Bartonella ancashensis]ALE03385.1 hypothetical protein PU02_0571 [Bartonella ancashensis]